MDTGKVLSSSEALGIFDWSSLKANPEKIVSVDGKSLWSDFSKKLTDSIYSNLSPKPGWTTIIVLWPVWQKLSKFTKWQLFSLKMVLDEKSCCFEWKYLDFIMWICSVFLKFTQKQYKNKVGVVDFAKTQGLFSKPSEKYIVSPNLCFLSYRPQILATCLFCWVVQSFSKIGQHWY